MLKILVVLIILGSLALYFIKFNNPEAKEWLQNNNNKFALAGNRFAGTEDAIKFIDLLYELGASKVVISKDSIFDEKHRIEQEGGPYADAIVVTLPSSDVKKSKLFEIIKNEAIAQGMEFNPETDVKNNKVFIWWD